MTDTQLSQESLFSRRFLDGMPDRFEQFGRGVIRGWLYDSAVVIHKAYIDPAGAAVENWFEMSLDTYADWSPTKAFRAIEYFPNLSRVLFATTVEEKAKMLAKSFPHMQGKAAIVVPRKFVTMSFRRFVNKTLLRLQPEMDREVFHHYDDAVAWLCEDLKVEKQSA
jgi:hypothetical protein